MFTWASFSIRVLAVHALVLGTYNPSGYSYVHWLTMWEPHYLALKILIGVTLVALFWIAIAATWFVLGVVGGLLLLVIVLAFAAMLWQFDLFPVTFWSAQFLMLLAVAAYLSIGVSSAHFKYRLTGQVQSRVLNPPQPLP
jgi:Family of unknown function (DUF6524)